MKVQEKPKVLLAMSGGVDSSVAAKLLLDQGYEVIGAFMRNWSDTKNKITGKCLWQEERSHALKIASILDIPLITLNFEKEYKKLVVDEMFSLYKKGITPNPDIDCNNKIKFPLLLKSAKKLKCDFLATGHYAQIKKTKKGTELLRAKDESKDQSYFLYRLSQKDLEHTIFPIGKLSKKEIREIAKKNKFPNANKKGTVGICFIGKVNLKEFLSKKIKPKKGKILDPEGKKIGCHDGIYYYTIGQKIGPKFGIDIKKTKETMKKWYVAIKNPKKNIIVAAPEDHPINFRKEIIIQKPHWINGKPKTPKKFKARIRQVGELIPCKLYKEKNKFKVKLDKKIKGVSNGQAIVLYKGKVCIGGGIISF